MIGISTTAHKKYTTSKKKKTDLSGISTTAYKKSSKNNGGFLGGLGYVGGNIAAGVAGVGEGIVDLFAAAGAAISGDTEYAKYVFKDNQAGEWHQSLTEDYNPGKVMNFLGDVGHGLGQSSVFLLNAIPGLGQLGTAAFFTGIIGQGISNAADKTGDVGAKEVVYGVGTGVTEGLLETYLGGAAKAAGSIGKGLVGNVAKNAVRRGLAKEILTGAGEEFLEEFVGEYTDVFWQRTTGVDKNASTSLKNAIYSGLVGAVSGGLSVGSTSVIKYGANQQRGKRIIQSGNAQTLVNTATSVADKLAGSGTDFKKAAEWVTALRGDVDAYNKLSPEQKVGAKGQTILGEMQAALAFAELQASFAGVQAKIENSDESTRAAFAEYINMTVDKSKRNKDYTAEDIAKNTDNVSWQIAVLDYVNGIADIDGAIAFEEAARAKVSGEQVDNNESLGTTKFDVDTELLNFYREVSSMKDANAKSKRRKNLGVISQSHADLISNAIQQETGKTIDLSGYELWIDGSAIQHIEERHGKNGAKDQSMQDEKDVSRITWVANNATNAEVLKNADGNLDLDYNFKNRDQSPSVKVKLSSPIDDSTFYVVECVPDSESKRLHVKSAYKQKNSGKGQELNIESKDPPQHTSKTLLDSDATNKIIHQNKPVVNTNSEKNIDKQDLADKPVKNAQEGAERSGKAVEGENAKQSAESENDGEAAKKTAQETVNEPKISEAKEALTDNQRKSRAIETARKWIEWENQTTPTAKELNEAREYVKDFDKLQNNRRLAILKMIRSSDGKVDKKILKGVTNIMAVNPKSDLEFRFSEGIGQRGLTTKIGDKTLIVIDSSTNFKNTVKGTIAHELVHYLENRAGYKEFSSYVRKHAKPEAVEKHRKRYTDFYRSVFTAEQLGGDNKTSFDLESVPFEVQAAVEERLMSKEMQELIDSEITASLVGDALQSERFLKRYANRDKKFIARVGSWLADCATRLKMSEEAKAAAAIADEYSVKVGLLLQLPAVREYKGNYIRYSLMNKDSLSDNVDRILKMSDEDAIVNKEAGNFVSVMKNTPKVILDNVEGANDLEIVMRFDSFYLATRHDGALKGHYHNYGDIMKNLPQIIADPQAIIKMDSGRINIYSQIQTKKGNNNIVSIELNTVKDINSKYEKYNLLVSVVPAKDNYARNNLANHGVKVEYEKEDLTQVNHQLHEWLAIVNERSSNNSIPQKSDLSTDYSKKDLPDTKFDLADNDTAYMSAVESGDMETVQKMVDEAARRAGYATPKLYHGTTAFGFTEFDFARSDDNLSVFATTDEEVAQTYTDESPRTSIGERVDITPEALENASDEQILSYLQKYVGKNYRIVKTDGSTNVARAYISGAHDKLVAFIGENSERITGRKNAILQKMVAAIETLQTADTYRAFRDAYGEYESSVWDLKWADNELVSDIRPLIVEDLRKAYSVLVTTLSKGGGVAFTDGERVLHRNKAITELKPKMFSGIYKLYGRTGDSFVVEGHGVDWNRIDGRVIGKNVHVTTRDVVEYASRRGYDSVTFKDIVDKGDVTDGGGESTVYAFLRQGALKSADPVTYDDNGKVIPLSQRFNADIADIRYDLADNATDAESLKAENTELKGEVKKMRSMLERMAREEAQTARNERAEIFDKKDIELATKIIEGWSRDEIMSLTKGYELQDMTRAKREEMISQIYIALHEQSAKGQTGPGSVAVKLFAAQVASDYIDSARIVGDDGKSYHLSDVYDEDSITQFKQELTDTLYGELSNMGKHTSTAEFTARLRTQKEAFKVERLNDYSMIKSAREVSYQATKLRELSEKQKRDMADEGIQEVTKMLGAVVDTKGNIRISAVDKAIAEASRFYSMENGKLDSQRSQIPENASITDFAYSSDQEMSFMIEELVRLRQGREGKALSAEEMKLLGKILRGMKVTIERFNKEYVNGHWVEIEKPLSDTVRDVKDFATAEKTYKTGIGRFLGEKVGGAINQSYFYNVLTPETTIETLEGYKKDGLLKTLYHSVRVARQRADHRSVRMKKPFDDFINDKENAWTNEKGKKRAYREKLNEKTVVVNGNEITLGEGIYLLMLTKREQAHAGLMEGGFITYDENNQHKTDFTISDIEAARDSIYNQLDNVDKTFLSMAEEFFNVTATKVKEDADMEIFGYTNVLEKYYVPIIRDRYSRPESATDSRQSIGSIITVYNKSFNQNTVQNAKALEGKNIMSIITDHADGLADYAELYLPLKAFDRVYNRVVVLDNGKTTTLRKVLQNDVWNGTEKYLKNLFQDIQGQSRKSDGLVDSFVGRLRSGWVSSVLGLNLKVVATQTTSFVAANQIIEMKYLAPAISKFVGDQSELGERANEYSDIIEARSFDMSALKAQGNVDKVTDLGKKSGFMIEWMDRRVCLAIFHAAELKAQDLTGHAVGTVENARAAAKIADEVIYTTQAMTSQAERSALQRSSSEVARTLSMFTADSVKNLSHMYGNVMKYVAHSRRVKNGQVEYQAELAKDRKAVARSAATLASIGVMLGIITQAFKYLYAKEEEEPEEKAKDFAMDIVSSTFNTLPIVSDIVDKFVFNYDISLNVFDIVNDTIEDTSGLFGMLGNAMSGKYVSQKEIGKNVVNSVKSYATMFGLPLAPLERTVTGLLRRFAPSTVYGYDSMFYSTSYTADLKDAVENGDEALAEHILESLYKNEINGIYTSEELGEVARLYREGHTAVLPQKVGRTINDVTLTKTQRKQFNAVYSQASAKVNAMIGSSAYQTLTDEQRARAIKNMYALYYNRAAAQVVGAEWTRAQAYSHLTDKLDLLFVSQAYKSGLAAYEGADGKTVSVKAQLLEYLDSLKIDGNTYTVIAYANGVRDSETTEDLLKYINSLGLSDDVKTQVATALGLTVRDGKLIKGE